MASWALLSPERPGNVRAAQTVEVIAMGVRCIDGLRVAVVQSNPIRESVGLSDCQHCVHRHRVVLAED
jgi:hypothetical protein